MSEKRHRQQQRRQRRKAVARPRSSAVARPSNGSEPDGELAELMTEMATIAVRDAMLPTSALDAEQWAACLVGTWHVHPLPGGEHVEELFFPGFTAALEQLGTARALATLRALSAVAAGDHERRAREAACRLAARGLSEPSWASELGRARPTAAALMFEEAFDDGVSVLIEFADADSEPHTLGIYIDHNMGGLVKDAFLAGPLSHVRAELELHAAKEVGAAIRDLELAEARARVEASLFMLDHTLDPPVTEDVRMLRALIDARVRLLPDGFALPDDVEEISPAQRDELLADFLASPQGKRWDSDEGAEDVVAAAIDFGADYNHGGPLRWSPVVVELFMTSWLVRKVARDAEFFERVPDVLRDWVDYAGRRRSVPRTPLREAVATVEHFRQEMLEGATNPDTWGPAKSFAIAAREAGVDLSDPRAIDSFVERYNDGLVV